jgi:hypothetical protein
MFPPPDIPALVTVLGFICDMGMLGWDWRCFVHMGGRWFENLGIPIPSLLLGDPASDLSCIARVAELRRRNRDEYKAWHTWGIQRLILLDVGFLASDILGRDWAASVQSLMRIHEAESTPPGATSPECGCSPPRTGRPD